MTNKALSRLRPELSELKAYVVADSVGFVKLDAMESPYTWPVDMRTRWLEHLSGAQVNRYPQPNPEFLKKKLKERLALNQYSDLLLGNGSDELIQLLVLAIAKQDACILTLSPSFSMYQMIAKIVGVECHVVPLDKNYELDLNEVLLAIKKHDPSLIFIAYPNNPTGNLWSRQDIQKILKKSQGIVVIDEAYGPFARDSFTGDLTEHENMLLLKTASKFGLAAIRFGWLEGDISLIGELNKIRLPYNINQLTQLTMEFALDNYSLFAEQAEMIRLLRVSLFNELLEVDGVRPFKSEANFILLRVLFKSADDVFARLLAQKVLVKNVSRQAGLSQCLRVTVGSKEENKIFCSALVISLDN